MDIIEKNSEIHISEGGVIWAKDIPQINTLLKQLSPKAPRVNYADIQEVMKHSTLFLACTSIRHTLGPDEDSCIIGMLTLTHARKPTGWYGMIEDVIVDGAFRQKGIARKLLKRAIFKAQLLNMAYIDFSNNPQGTEAHALCESEGFVLRTSNYFRLNIAQK